VLEVPERTIGKEWPSNITFKKDQPCTIKAKRPRTTRKVDLALAAQQPNTA